MVRDEKMYEEIDKATTAQMSINLLENYAIGRSEFLSVATSA